MLSKSISFPTYFEEDIENSNIDVFVELEDGYTYTVVVGIAKNIEYLIDKERMNYSKPSYLFIFVKKVTEEIISEAIEAYASNEAYWLKLYHFAGRIDTALFNKLQAEKIKDQKEFIFYF